MTCSHCTHPMYAAIRCSACGRWTDEKEEKMHRIDELIQQATMVFEPDDPDYRQAIFDKKLFAELIVKECVPFVGDPTSVAVKEMMRHFGVEQ